MSGGGLRHPAIIGKAA